MCELPHTGLLILRGNLRAIPGKGTPKGNYMRKRTAIAVAIMSAFALMLWHSGLDATSAVVMSPEPTYAVTTDPYLPIHGLESTY